ncbi:hypothetical protein [Sulfitobacter sp.]|jgi:integrase|uniref:hypothetical protein n=1 Tax=Sulfitobacter sp. TaxID=1903071 RepID=UPI0039E4AADA
MQVYPQLFETLKDMPVASSLLDRLTEMAGSAPQWLNPEAESWNVAPLHRLSNVRNFTLDFTKIKHRELRVLSRVFLLWRIVDRNNGPQALLAGLSTFRDIGEVLGSRPVSTLNSDDLYDVEDLIRDLHGQGTFARRCGDLQYASKWLTRHAGIRAAYTFKYRREAAHGRDATDDQRDAKLLPDRIVSDLLAARLREENSDRDKFFLCVVAIAAATGFRLMELLTLPKDCLIKDQGALLMRSFASKSGKPAPRPVAPEMADIVIDAVAYVESVTEPARQHAELLAKKSPVSWAEVLRTNDPKSLEYFCRRWLAEWIAAPVNRMIDGRMAYFSKGSKSAWVPIAALLDKHSGNISAISRETGYKRETINKLVLQLKSSQRGVVYLGKKSAEASRGFDTDKRFPSMGALNKHIGINVNGSPHAPLITSLINEARTAQIMQKPFFAPRRNRELERRFHFKSCVLQDTDSGLPILELQNALFVTFKNQLSVKHKCDVERVVAVSNGQFSNWASGYKRDRGTGKPGDAVCARLRILDPRTGEPAHFTNHDFRHWLETSYENGGLTQTQIAALFNRHSTTSNSVYDQTSSKVRRKRLQNAMVDGLLIGHAAQAFDRIAKEGPKEAAEYLETSTKFYNPMPHGICRLNWALEPCPHTLSCFSCDDENFDDSKPCVHLIVDTTNEAQLDEIDLIHRNASEVMNQIEEIGGEASPQYVRFDRIARSTASLLKDARKR